MKNKISLVMFLSWFLLMLLVSIAACGPFARPRPDAAARKGFEDWAKTLGTNYRNPVFEVSATTDTSATVKITAELQAPATNDWIESISIVQIRKVNNEWQSPTSFAFTPSPRAQATLQVFQNATATTVAVRRQATADAAQAALNATATSVVATQAARATQAVATQVARATELAKQATAAAAAQVTAIAAQTQQAQLAQATRSAQATQAAIARATLTAERTTIVNKTPVIQSIRNDSTGFRDYYKNINFKLDGVERGEGTSVLFHFSVWNLNSSGDFRLDRHWVDRTYIISAEGKKYDALDWDDIRAVAGERREWVIAFNAPSTIGSTYNVFLFTRVWGDRPLINWEPIQVTLK